MDEARRYYDGPVDLAQAEKYIEASLVTTAREYVAIGYWLRRIRDEKLFLEEGHKNFEEYVRQKYRKDGGWASKCIKVNGQFSVGGNSPYLSEEYQGYSKYQLVELAYMTEEQRELVDADTPCREMKQIRKPEPENQAVEPAQVASQTELVTSQVESDSEPQDEEPESEAEAVISQPEPEPETQMTEGQLDGEIEIDETEKVVTLQPESDPEVIHFTAGNRTIDNAYGATIAAAVRKYLDSGYARPEKECEVAALGLTYKVLKRQDITVFYTDTGRTVFDVENTRLEEEYQYWHGNKAEPEVAVSQPEPPQEPEPNENGNCPPGATSCERQEWGTDPEEQKAGKEECRKCWAAWKRRQNKLGAAEVQQETKDVHPEPALQRHPEKPEPGQNQGQERENIGGVPVFSMENKMTAEGAYGWKRSEIINGYLKALHREESFTIANKIIPIEFQVMGNTYRANYDGYYYVGFKRGEQAIMFVELDRLKAEYAEKYPPKKAKPAATYDKSILQSMIKFEQEQLDMMGPSWMEKQPYHYTKHMMALEAFRMLQAAHEGEENEGKVVG